MFKLNLKEIPQEGRSYSYTRASGEITQELEELIKGHDFAIDFSIRPMGNVYELKGRLRTGVEEVCAKCGWDLKLPLEKSFQDYLIQEGENPRGSRAVHGNQSLDLESEGPDYTFYQGGQFAVGEYFHEMIALNEPSYPSCGKSDCEHLKEALDILKNVESGFTQPHVVNPFLALKDLKMNKDD